MPQITTSGQRRPTYYFEKIIWVILVVLVVIYCLNYDDSGDFGVFTPLPLALVLPSLPPPS